jgi:hypothetical protein
MEMRRLSLCWAFVLSVEAFAAPTLHFEPNLGQADPRARFIARASGALVFITPDEMIAVDGTGGRVVRTHLVGARRESEANGEECLIGTSNYFLGNDPAKWRTGVPHYGRVRFSGVYEGIDMVYRGNGGDLQYDFVVKPGADPRAIAFRFEGVDGADIDDSGDLVIRIGNDVIRQRAPLVYQEFSSGRLEVCGGYVRRGSGFAFRVEAWDPKRPLIIDPVIVYSTLLGGNSTSRSCGSCCGEISPQRLKERREAHLCEI